MSMLLEKHNSSLYNKTNSSTNNKSNTNQTHTTTTWCTQSLYQFCKSVCFSLNNHQLFEKHIYNKENKEIFSKGYLYKEDNLLSSKLINDTRVNEGRIDFDCGFFGLNSSNGRNRLIMTSTPTSNQQHRDYDVVIFGASSLVGRFLVEELALVVDKYYSNSTTSNQHSTITSTSSIKEHRDPIQFAQLAKNHNNNNNSKSRRESVPRRPDEGIRWAVAGRSAAKLSDTLNKAEFSTGIRDLSNNVPVLLADLDHHKSLLNMCQRTKIVINCVGPYLQAGEVVIRACLESKTSYIDLAHEACFIEQMRQKYSAQALKAKIYIINGCGFHSMSAELGLMFIKQMVDGQIDKVNIMLSLSDTKAHLKSSGSSEISKSSGLITQGMWHSLLVDKAKEIPSFRPHGGTGTISNLHQNDSSTQREKQNHPQLERRDTQSLVRDMVKIKNNKAFAFLTILRGIIQSSRKYCLPTNSLTISEESQLINGEMGTYATRSPDLVSMSGWRPISCNSFIAMKSFMEVLTVLVWLVIFNALVRFSPFRSLMKAFPSLFSLGNVTSNKDDIERLNRESLSHIKFCQTFVAYGTPNDGSGDPLENQRDRRASKKQEKLLVARMVGPEPNRIASATYAIQAALTLILERDHLPSDGGVITPGAAFSETNIIYHLRKRNIKFEILKKA